MNDMTGIDPDLTPQQNISKLAFEIHAVKGHVAALEALTKSALSGVDSMAARMDAMTESLVKISDNTSGLVNLSKSVERSATWMCKAARAFDWIAEKATGKFGKFCLVAWAIYAVATQRKLPDLFVTIFKALG